MCIGLSYLLIRDQKPAPSPYLFRYLQHISVLPATGTINHPLTPGWSAGSWGDPSCLFVDRLLNCLEKRWDRWHLLHLREVQVAHTPYVVAFCTAWRKHLYDWTNWMGEHFFAVYSIWITAAMGKLCTRARDCTMASFQRYSEQPENSFQYSSYLQRVMCMLNGSLAQSILSYLHPKYGSSRLLSSRSV